MTAPADPVGEAFLSGAAAPQMPFLSFTESRVFHLYAHGRGGGGPPCVLCDREAAQGTDVTEAHVHSAPVDVNSSSLVT